jgi:hypothetical protein
MRTVIHPGPIAANRVELVPCFGQETVVTLEAGIALESAVARALAPLGFDSAWLELSDAAVERLSYVIPALSKDGKHAAWYSDVQSFTRGHIKHIGMIVGRHDGESFLHGHGLWQATAGKQAMGHILAQQTVLTEAVSARCIGLKGACFDRREDEETNFTLFHVDPVREQESVNNHQSPNKSFAALRVLPNQEFETAINTACLSLGWSAARVFGLGSLIGSYFEDGSILHSLPTEFLINEFVAGDVATRPDITIVGIDGSQIFSGCLSRGKNAVLVTAELVLKKLE